MKEFFFYYKKTITTNYINFKGRARRKEYWMFTLVNFLIGYVLLFVDELVGIPSVEELLRIPPVTELAGELVGIFMLEKLLGIPISEELLEEINFGTDVGTSVGIRILSLIYSLAVFIPITALSVRRLHDIGKSGWFYFLNLVPLIGSIILVVWACFKGNEGENKYGPDPKGTLEAEETF